MTKQTVIWRQDGIDPVWFIAEGIGSVRSSKSYNRPGGWWFLPAWLPDTEEHDIGEIVTADSRWTEPCKHENARRQREDQHWQRQEPHAQQIEEVRAEDGRRRHRRHRQGNGFGQRHRPVASAWEADLQTRLSAHRHSFVVTLRTGRGA